ncbi:hypothetical protein DXG03_007583 [Asterophora parasitica]|uniref:Carboxylic ester hydrolase n=1 Tax=Asterophora parasitica TaxID=117018 RepID=A0A9P7G9X6_9AGAR|nr:hypothetical protein DXG03_007583 [Asterophora parasitica]
MSRRDKHSVAIVPLFLSLVLDGTFAFDHVAASASLKTLSLANTTVLSSTNLPEPVAVQTRGACDQWGWVSDPICRVQVNIRTSATPSVYAEAWLPDTWYGRIVGLGNGGVGGYMYPLLCLPHSLALPRSPPTTGDIYTGQYFLNNPDVIKDFSYSATHLQTVIGKQLVQAYYGRPHDKSYFLGCSTGGRQGTQAAFKCPEDFDGIVAGAPGTDWNHLLGWWGGMECEFGAPKTPGSSVSYILRELWDVVEAEVLNQCDALDGAKDGIITEPDDCNFRPEVLFCSSTKTEKCLSQSQVNALKKAYAPLAGDSNGITGIIEGSTLEWYLNTVFNNTSYNFSDFGLPHIALADMINPGDAAMFSGDFSAFKNCGGKFVTYHRDQATLSARTTSSNLSTLDTFYRLFLVPGMQHCNSGPGSWAFGQSQGLNVVNASTRNVLGGRGLGREGGSA